MTRLQEQVWSEVKTLLLSREGTTPELGLAVSGGTDSRALLELMQDYPAKLHIIHVDHGLRPTSSEEAEQVAALATEKELEFHLYRYALQDYEGLPTVGLEAQARMLRYRAFEDWLSQGDRVLLLGHHADDQAETILLSLFRGSHIKGLRGMPRTRGNYLRPFLGIRRKTLEEYLRERAIVAIEDESNQELNMTRNRIRHEVMPLLGEVFQRDPVDMLLRTSVAIEENIDLNNHLLTEAYGDYLLNIDGIYKVPETESSELLRALLHSVLPAQDLSRDHFLAMADIMRQHEYKSLDLPHYIFASAWGYYAWGNDAKELKLKLSECVQQDYPQVNADALQTITSKSHNQWALEMYRGHALGGPWYFQVEQEILPLLEWKTLETLEDPTRWRKKLKKLGVPAPVREKLPLCFLKEKLVWVPGFKIERQRAGDISLFWNNASIHNAI